MFRERRAGTFWELELSNLVVKEFTLDEQLVFAKSQFSQAPSLREGKKIGCGFTRDADTYTQ